MEDLLDTTWEKCFKYMEKASQTKNEKVANLWKEKLVHCKKCKEGYFENLKRTSTDPLETWTNAFRKCSLCLLGDLEQVVKDEDVKTVEAYKDSVQSCMAFMMAEFSTIPQKRAMTGQ
ncbi:MAG: hypothetical protein HXS46_02380 [Theionarchaea archaeon]|nr:MAG: hypothetical protein AYK18_05060 [Theionarchaea archaeon DG-70]MBU7009511.1 hypothetical protein [Theionarchaea archaeon]